MKKVMVAMALGLLSISALAAEVKVESKNLDALQGSKKLVLANFVVEFQKEYHSTSIFSGIMGLGASVAPMPLIRLSFLVMTYSKPLPNLPMPMLSENSKPRGTP